MRRPLAIVACLPVACGWNQPQEVSEERAAEDPPLDEALAAQLKLERFEDCLDHVEEEIETSYAAYLEVVDAGEETPDVLVLRHFEIREGAFRRCSLANAEAPDLLPPMPVAVASSRLMEEAAEEYAALTRDLAPSYEPGEIPVAFVESIDLELLHAQWRLAADSLDDELERLRALNDAALAMFYVQEGPLRQQVETFVVAAHPVHHCLLREWPDAHEDCRDRAERLHAVRGRLDEQFAEPANEAEEVFWMRTYVAGAGEFDDLTWAITEAAGGSRTPKALTDRERLEIEDAYHEVIRDHQTIRWSFP